MLRLIAVVLLVVGLVLGLLTGWDVPLGETLFRYNPALLNTAQAGIQRYTSPAIRDDGVLPLLERPAWVLLAVLGALLLMLRGLLLPGRRERSVEPRA